MEFWKFCPGNVLKFCVNIVFISNFVSFQYIVKVVFYLQTSSCNNCLCLFPIFSSIFFPFILTYWKSFMYFVSTTLMQWFQCSDFIEVVLKLWFYYSGFTVVVLMQWFQFSDFIQLVLLQRFQCRAFSSLILVYQFYCSDFSVVVLLQ